MLLPINYYFCFTIYKLQSKKQMIVKLPTSMARPNTASLSSRPMVPHMRLGQWDTGMSLPFQI